jgi:hypothetical protein
LNQTGPAGSTGPNKPDRSCIKAQKTLKNFIFSLHSLSSAGFPFFSHSSFKIHQEHQSVFIFILENDEFSGGGAAAITAAPPPEN